MKKLFYFLPLMFFVFSCEKDPVEPNDEELITTLRLEFTNGASTKVIQFQDLDGDGGQAPLISGDTLDANTTYTLNVFVLNEAESPIEDINEEILEEGDEHQFFFITDENNIQITYNDADVNARPIGLVNTCQIVAAGSYSLQVVLRHQPDKAAVGVSTGNIANAGGESYIEVDFTVNVQ